jgi:hypothetical protein
MTFMDAVSLYPSIIRIVVNKDRRIPASNVWFWPPMKAFGALIEEDV